MRNGGVLSADDIQQVRDGLWFWQRFQPSVKVDCSSCAVRVGTKLILVDPIPLNAGAQEELLQLGEPAAIIATNGNHDRAIAQLRAKLGVPVFAHADAVPALGFEVERMLSDGDVIFDSLEVIEIPGAGVGEIALHDSRGWLIVGDALTNLEPDGLALLPAKYCTDARQMRVSLGKLLRFPSEVLTFAHGLPVVSRARPRLESLLA